MSKSGECAFCKTVGPLCESHVLPAFVYRWLRGRSGTSHIRHSDQPNRRVQDGLKFHWLCRACEDDFNKYETAFATKVFHPWHAGTNVIPYGDWLLKFCVSVSWRVLKFARGYNKDHSYASEQSALLDEAEKRWRDFLQDKVAHPGPFEQHLLIFDIAESTTIPDLPKNFNRYMTGAMTLDIVGSDRSLMTFAKMGRFIVFGLVQKGPGPWEGTRICVRDGVLKPGKFVVPAGLLSLFREKAEFASRVMASMSDSQKAKVDAELMKNLDKFATSDHFASILADARMFGEDAILRKD